MAGDGVISNLYTVHAVDWAGTGATTLGQIINSAFDPGLSHAIAAAVGDLDGSFIALQSANPRFRFTTTQATDALALLDANFARAIANLDEVDVYFAKRLAGDHLAGATSHVKMTINDGILILRQIRAPHQGRAELDFEIAPLSVDGTTAPITIVSNASLQTIDAVDEEYTAGPIKIDSSWVNDVQNWTLDIGVEPLLKAGAGCIWPTFASVQSPRLPVLTVDGFDLAELASLGAEGGALPGTVLAYLRKKAADGAGNVAAASAAHVKASIPKGQYDYDARGTIGEDSPSTLTIRAIKSGATAALTITTGQAIA